MPFHVRWITTLGLIALAAHIATAQPCAPAVADYGLVPVVPGVVSGMASYEDGTGAGQRFYVCGTIASLGNVALLTGAGGSWQQVGAGIPGTVRTLDVLPDGQGPGGGPSLYAGGASGIFRLATEGAGGPTWQAVTPALPPTPNGEVYSVRWFDDNTGSGAQLHCLFGTSTLQLLKLQSGSWRVQGTLVVSQPTRMIQRVHVYDEDGPGPLQTSMFIASGVQSATPTGGATVQSATSGMMRWDGISFSVLPSTPYGPWVKAAAVYDDSTGSGEQLYISGHSNTRPMMKWDGATQNWINIGPANPSGFVNGTQGMAVVQDGLAPSGGRLYGASDQQIVVSPSGSVIAWDGQQWRSVPGAPGTASATFDYHLAAAAGTFGAAHVPAMLSVGSGGVAPGTTFVFAIVTCPRCATDINLDGVNSVTDIFTFIDAWFARRPSANFNGTDGVTVQDIFDYLNAWFGGCG